MTEKKSKFKCTNCEEEFEENELIMECHKCYMGGICKELTRVFEDYLKLKGGNK
jgi:Zn finger protein HypA/HybF involved in hydrogenase expression